MLKLLFSLTGFLFGLALSFIAPEELKLGKKYFILIKNILFYLTLGFSLFLFSYFKSYYWILLPLVYASLYFIFLKKLTPSIQEIYNYISFVIIYFISFWTNPKTNLLIILPVLFFLYGLPSGTLVRLNSIEKQEKKYELKSRRKTNKIKNARKKR